MSKRFYNVGEKVWLIEGKRTGVIKDLKIKPEEKVFKASVEYLGDNELTVTHVFDLWEIDKYRPDFYRDQRKQNKLVTILFAKVRDTAIIPSKEDENAGYDIYANFEEDEFVIQAHETKLIPTGIASSLTDDWSLIAKERGSTGSRGFGLRAGVIDSGYRNEIFIAMTNTNVKPVVISKLAEVNYNSEDVVFYPYSKAIAQLMLVEVPKARVKEISYEELQKIPSKRGMGKLGSSNK